MFEPILRYLPRYLDRDPALRPALRLVAPSPASWRVREDRLTLAWDGQTREFDLTEHTLASLVDALQGAGFELAWFDQDLYALGAVILWDGSGTIDDRDGTEFRVRTSLLHALTRSLEHEWVALRDAIPEAARQVSMATAEQVWLDRHGRLYGIARPPGSDDAAYRTHLMEEITRPRGNARGIEYTLRRLLAEDIRVIEPWQQLARWSVSPASVEHRFPDGARWAKNLLHLAFTDPGDWEGAQAIAESDRDAGNILLDPAWWPLARSIGAGISNGAASLMRSDVRALYAKGWHHPVWGMTAASDYDLVLNHRFMLVLWMTAYADGHVQGAKLDQGRHFCRGDAVLSEDTPFGGINTRFRGAWYFEALGAARRLSDDLALSDYAVERNYRLICNWSEAALAPTSTVTWPDFRAGGIQAHQTHRFAVDGRLFPASRRTWSDVCWGDIPWQSQDARFTQRTEIRICEQMPDGATPSWSDSGALSDYADGLTCRVIDYDPALGITYPDPYTQQIITIPPRPITAQRASLRICRQRADGATPTFSGAGALSDYVDGIACEIRYTDPLISNCARLTEPAPPSASEPGAIVPAPTVDRGDQAAIRLCRQLDPGVSAAFSGGERLSDYFDRLHCERMAFDRVVSVSVIDGKTVLRRCEQRSDGLSASFSGALALSDHMDGIVCQRLTYDPATGLMS